MQTVVLTEMGIAVFEEKKCKKSFPFSNPSKEYISVRKGEARIDDLLDYVANLDGVISVSDEALLSILKKNSIDAQLMSEDGVNEIHAAKPEILVTAGFAKDQNDAMTKLRDFAIQLSSSKVTEVSESPDLHIIQAINTLDDIDKIGNGVSSRLREWYGLHFPELDNIIDSVYGYAQIVLAGKRSQLTKNVFEDAGFPESKVEMLLLVSEKSRGGDISDENLSIVQSLAKQIVELHDLRKKLESHIETQMNEVAPNFAAILGTAVGARILARAGGLKKLASMPASTIQVLGAEKALFRSLKTGSQPPKHGLLFQHALVHAAPRWQRGKIARAVAAKAAIAARVDVYGGGLNKTLLEKLNIRVDEIGKKYKEPSEKKPTPRGDYRSDRGESRGNRDFRRSDGDKPRGERNSYGRSDGDKPRGERNSYGRSDRGESRDNNKPKMKDKKRKKFGRR